MIFRYEFAENLAIRARHRRHLRPRLERHPRRRRRLLQVIQSVSSFEDDKRYNVQQSIPHLSRLLLHPHLLHLRPHPLCHRHHRHHHLDDAEIC